jgi:hypothetical protein
MMTWYKVPLTADQIGNDAMVEIQKQFQSLFDSSGSPKEMALFCDKEPFGISISLYFSPTTLTALESLIKAYSGIPCEKPKKDSMALLVGHQNAWDLLE